MQRRECFRQNRDVTRDTCAMKHSEVPVSAGNMEAVGSQETSLGVSGPGPRWLKVEGCMAAGQGQASDRRQESGVR